MDKRKRRPYRRCSRPDEGERAASLIRAIGIRLAAEWIKELVEYCLGHHDPFL